MSNEKGRWKTRTERRVGLRNVVDMAKVLSRRLLRQPPSVIALIMLFFCLAVYQMMSSNRRGAPTVREEIKILKPRVNDIDVTVVPIEYNETTMDPQWCDDHFGKSYLSNYLNAATLYCSDESSSQMTCFNSRVDEMRTDSFCVGGPASFHPEFHRFSIDCVLRELGENDLSAGVVPVDEMADYMHSGGTKWTFQNWVHLTDPQAPIAQEPRRGAPTAVLVKRDDANNSPWNALLEVMSAWMSMDILRATHNLETGRNYLIQSDYEDLQVVLLDDLPEGPYFHLWQLFAKKPVLRISDHESWPKLLPFRQIITVLPGGSNPFWLADWQDLACYNSTLIRVFTQRVFETYNIPIAPKSKLADAGEGRRATPIQLTFVTRRANRRVVSSEALLAKLSMTFSPDVLSIQRVSLEDIPFEEQLSLIHEQTDILVGVHGAGLVQTMFLQPGSALVELTPFNLDKQPFFNIAKLSDDITYKGIQTKDEPRLTKAHGDWKTDDVAVDEQEFVDVLSELIHSMAEKRGLGNPSSAELM